MPQGAEEEKRLAAEAAAELVADGMTVGLGTGSTVDYLLPALSRRNLSLRCVATSRRTADAARALGMHVKTFHGIDRLDIAIDGADQIAPDGWLVKGGGGAHTREKLVAVTAECFVVIADSTKLVEQLHEPIPLELLSFGLASTLRRLAPTRSAGHSSQSRWRGHRGLHRRSGRPRNAGQLVPGHSRTGRTRALSLRAGRAHPDRPGVGRGGESHPSLSLSIRLLRSRERRAARGRRRFSTPKG